MVLPASKKQYERLRLLLIEAREEAGITQVELGKKLRRPQSFVSKIERGLRSVDVIEFIEIAKAIGVEPVDLICDLTDSRQTAASDNTKTIQPTPPTTERRK